MASLPRPSIPLSPAGIAEAPARGISLSELLTGVKNAIEKSMPQAVWVRAEIARLDRHKGMIFLDLTERDGDGNIIAKCEGRIWKNVLPKIDAAFVQATGEPLKQDIKVLCHARIRLHESHGLALHIEDIDPAYTLGDLAARLAYIRERLRDESIADMNRQLPAPLEFVRVAIISPQSSAGLEDFRREADHLQACGLCCFTYFTAAFQSADAPQSIREAIRAVHALHKANPFDVVAIIRGGGSVTDLAWLNDYLLAKWVCRLPIPVFTGIGHKPDNTILDEVAHTRFDTPSKVILHILGTIWRNAVEASRAAESIRNKITSLLVGQESRIDEALNRLRTGVASRLATASTRCESDKRLIIPAMQSRLREAAATLDARTDAIRTGAVGVLSATAQELAQQASLCRERSMSRLHLIDSAINRQAREVTLTGLVKLDKAVTALQGDLERIASEAADRLRDASKAVDDRRSSIQREAYQALEDERKSIDREVRSVVASGPEATLRRGFALARDDQRRAVTSRAAASRLPSFDLCFHDGDLHVFNPRPENGHE